MTLQGNEILSHLSPEEYSCAISVIEDAILATDLAVYFKYVIDSKIDFMVMINVLFPKQETGSFLRPS